MDDLPLARGLWCDAEVMQFIGGPLSEETLREKLAREMANDERLGAQYWPMFRREGGDFVGCCGLRPRDEERRIFAFGFHLRPEHWNRGYAFEAGSAVIDHAFAALGVPELFAGHHPENHASRRVLAKLGFSYTHDELYPPTGLLHPSYSLLR
jgi:RimJ/RimL family protein N-acetyltransferase